jgi:hypothetical protein
VASNSDFILNRFMKTIRDRFNALMLQIYNCFSEKLYAIIVPDPGVRFRHSIILAGLSGIFTSPDALNGLPDNAFYSVAPASSSVICVRLFFQRLGKLVGKLRPATPPAPRQTWL